MVFISHFFALASSALFIGCFLQMFLKHTEARVEAKHDNKYADFLQALRDERQHFRHASIYFFFTGLITSLAFYLINYLPKWVTGGFCAEIISTGIHVTVILMIISFLLRFSKLEVPVKKKLLYLIALTTSISFIFWDWRMGLTALCIVAGRDVWMDFLLDFKINKVKRFLHELQAGHSIEGIIGRYCAAYMVAFMYFQLVDRIVKATGRSEIFTILICVTPLIMIGLALWTNTIFFKRVNKALSK